MDRQIRVVIADDHEVVREGFRSWLDAESDITVAGEARDGAEALRLVKDLRPDVLLQDLRIPRLDGLKVIRALRDAEVAVRVLVITGFDSRGVQAALDAGACGYLTKEEKREVLVEAVRWAASRAPGIWISPTAAAELNRNQREMEDKGLTKAERRVLRLIELTNAEIAGRLCLSESTVKNHLTRIYDKLGVRSRNEAREWARTYGVEVESTFKGEA